MLPRAFYMPRKKGVDHSSLIPLPREDWRIPQKVLSFLVLFSTHKGYCKGIENLGQKKRGNEELKTKGKPPYAYSSRAG